MPQFETKTIEELTNTLIDYRGKTPEKTLEGVKLITAKVIKEGFIQDGNHEFIAEENYNSWMRRGLPKQWDILITTEAPLGEVAQLRTPEKVALAQRVILLRGKSDLIDQGYYFQTFKSDFVQAELNSRGTGTTVLGIKQSELLKVRIPYYPLPTQQKIAAILSAYDDLIENNTRRIKILEEMAQVIYREWFVKDSQDNNFSTISLQDICHHITDGKHGDCQDEDGSGYYFISCKDVKEGLINYLDARQITEKDFLETHKRTQLQTDDIVITNSGTIGRMAIVPNTENIKRTTFQKSVAIVKPNKEKVLPNWLFFYLQSNKDTLIEWAGGTAQKNLLLKDLRAFKVLLPPFSLISRFEQVSQPMRKMIELLHEKNAYLISTRDLLLPKLISGGMDVSGLDILIPKAKA